MGTADILTLVQSAPDISTNNETWVNTLIEKAKGQVKLFCNLPEFPILSQGNSVSAASATENISGLSTNTIWVGLNGDSVQEITLTLANCDTGAHTAAEFQTQLRTVDDGTTATDHLWGAITVAWDGDATQYTITNPTFGEASAVATNFESEHHHCIAALKLSALYGGEETQGTWRDKALEYVCAQMVIDAYRAVMLSPESYEEDTSKATLVAAAFEKSIKVNKQMLLPRRRLTF